MNAHALTLAGAMLLVSAASPARASDPRLTQRLYDADTVVRIDGRLGIQASVAFAEAVPPTRPYLVFPGRGLAAPPPPATAPPIRV